MYRPQRSCGKEMFSRGGGGVSQHALRQTPPPGQCMLRYTPRADTPTSSRHTLPLGTHPPPAATAADGTHPTGMHSCFILVLDYSEFGNNEHLALTIRFLCIKIIDGNSKKFVYNEHIFTTRMHSSRMRTVRCSGRLLKCICPGVSAWGRSLPGGVSAGGVSGLGYVWQTPPTDRCKNITLPQLRCGR